MSVIYEKHYPHPKVEEEMKEFEKWKKNWKAPLTTQKNSGYVLENKNLLDTMRSKTGNVANKKLPFSRMTVLHMTLSSSNRVAI